MDFVAAVATWLLQTSLVLLQVDLTWDETDRDRLKVTMFNPNQGKGKKDEVQEDDFKAYLASSSDEEGIVDISYPQTCHFA